MLFDAFRVCFMRLDVLGVGQLVLNVLIGADKVGSWKIKVLANLKEICDKKVRGDQSNVVRKTKEGTKGIL
jgi:hypothetical protein